MFEARFDRAFHALKRDAYAWGGLQKGKNKNLIARSLSPTEGKKRKSKLFWGDSGENWNPTSSGDCSIISASSPRLHLQVCHAFSSSSSLHPISLQSLPLFISPSRALSFPFPSLFISHWKTTLAPPLCCLIFFLFISHPKTTPASPLCFLIFFLFISHPVTRKQPCPSSLLFKFFSLHLSPSHLTPLLCFLIFFLFKSKGRIPYLFISPPENNPFPLWFLIFFI